MEFENLQIEVPQNDESSPLYGVKVYVSNVVNSLYCTSLKYARLKCCKKSFFRTITKLAF